MNIDIMELLQGSKAGRGAVVCVIFLVGWLLARVVSRSVERIAIKHLDHHRGHLAKRFAYYLILVLTLVTGLNEAGINLSVVVGAAGVASVAIGFASQTSMSNLISGIFVIVEKPFMVGDTIRIGTTTGDVVSMGLLSTILKTPENVMVRIPNEHLMKSEIFNITRCPVRRFDVVMTLSYSSDLDHVKKVLMALASGNPLILKSPLPTVSFRDFGSTGIGFVLSVWVKAENLATVSFEVPVQMKNDFEQANIHFVTPQRPISIADAKALRVELPNSTS
jgi:small-conductance mechanosensitive channel